MKLFTSLWGLILSKLILKIANAVFRAQFLVKVAVIMQVKQISELREIVLELLHDVLR